MGLFDKSEKSKTTQEDISEIKQMSAVNQSTTTSELNPSINQTQTPESVSPPQEQFVNPFSEQLTPPQSSSNSNLSSSTQQFQTDQSTELPSFNSTLPSQTPSTSQPLNTLESHYQSSQFSSQRTPSNIQIESPEPNTTSSQSSENIQSLINETVEKIIEEKWIELTNNVQKVVDWKSKVEEQITLIKEDIAAMQEGFSTLEKRLISKINSYDRSILDVGSEIKALDKVFQKITPTLVNNVTELGRIAKDLKGVSRDSSSSTELRE